MHLEFSSVAAARTNRDLGILDREIVDWIIDAGEEVMHGDLDAHFPLRIWQTGSGYTNQHEYQRSHR